MPSYPGGVGLMIGIPSDGKPVCLDWAFSLCNLHPPMNFDVRWVVIKGKPVDEARQLIAEEAVKQKCKYLFFLGTDNGAPPQTLRQLIFHLEHWPQFDVAGGIYCHKSPPQAPMVFRGNGVGPYWDWKVGEVFEVTGLGMDATLIRCSVFEKMSKPWFKTVDDVSAFLDGTNKSEHWTEDLYFCKKVTDEAKGRIMADGGILVTHWDNPTATAYGLPPNCKPLLRAGVKPGDKKIVDLGCGAPDSSYKTEEGEVLRVDWREDAKPDYRCDLRMLPFATGEFDIVYSSHTLEHFPRNEVNAVVDEWIRILKPEGEFRLMLPNLEWAARQILNQEIDVDVMNVLYGAQTYDENYHKMGFTPKIVEQLLTQKGFKAFVWDFHNYHMFVRAWRVRPECLAQVNPIVRLKKDGSQADITLDVLPENQPKLVAMSDNPDSLVYQDQAQQDASQLPSLAAAVEGKANGTAALDLEKTLGEQGHFEETVVEH